MKVILSTLIFLIGFNVFGIEYNQYTLDKVIDIEATEDVKVAEANKVLYLAPWNKGATGPSIYFNNGVFEVSDDAYLNERRSFVYNKTLTEYKVVNYAFYLEAKYIYNDVILTEDRSSDSIRGLDKQSNKELFEVKLYLGFPELLTHFKSLFYHDSVLFIHDNKYNLWSIKNPGLDNKKNRQNLVGEEETLALINSGEIEGVTVDSKKRLFLDGELQTTSFQQYASYYQEINNDVVSKNKQFGTTYKTLLSYSNMTFLGIDNFNSYYWKAGGRWMIIFNNKGQIIEAFTYDSKKSDTLPAVSPEGDVYFLDYGKDKVTLYKVERQW